MLTLRLKSSAVELEQREATCNFCKKKNKDCTHLVGPHGQVDICHDCIKQLAKMV